MLDSVSLSLGGVGGVEDKTADASKSLNQTYDQFLTLLTTQLKNQDPLNPMDSKDFTNQLISMAGVEQQISQSSKMDDLLKLNQASTVNSTLLGYLGMQVDYKGKDFTYSGGTAIQFDYTNSAAAANTTVNIYDKNNTLVWSADGDKTAGDHQIIWPGTDSTGKRVDVGNYRFEVVSKDASNAAVATTTPVTNFTFSNTAGINLKYNLAAEASKTQISIVNSAGNTVWSGAGETASGDHTLTWTGLDNDGKPVAAGNYSIVVGATDSSNKAVTTTTTVPALVSGVEADDGSINLVIGSQKVPVNDVTAVRLPS
jgi:flagellar basal-body rod modification protein FlgD